MTVPVQISPTPPPSPELAAANAAIKLVRMSLDALAAQVGQQLAGKVLPGAPAGLTQIALADQVLTLKLSMPLPAGTQVQLQVQPGPNGQPNVTVLLQPQPVPQVAQSLPIQVQAALPQVVAQPLAQPQPLPAPPQPQLQTAATQALPAPVTTTAQPVGNVAAAPATPSAPPAAPAVMVQPAPTQSQSAPAQQAPVAAAPTPQSAAPQAAPITPAPASAAPAPAGPAALAAAQAPTAPQPAPVVATAPQVPVAPTPATSPPAPMPVAPQAPGISVAPAPVVQPTVMSAAAPAPAAPVPASPPPAPQAAPQPVPTLSQRVASSFTPLPTAAPPPQPGSPAQAVLSVATQAAANQQSAAPLLQNLAVRLPGLPTPVAEAAQRLLAGRINLDRGAPSAETIKQAVLRSGVLLDPPGKPGAPPDAKQALTQLRSALMNWLGGDVAAVAPVTSRPPPPTRGAAPRAQSPELPASPEGSGKEVGKALLSQTEGALSRIRLMQMTSQPPDAGRPGVPAPAAEWNLELPMMLGHELAMAHLQIGRDGKNKADPRERGWRLRFALKFSVLGEVGAQISMMGSHANVSIWAEEEATVIVLEEMLPELAPALAAKGLEIASLRVRRGAPEPQGQPAGRLMDAVR